ncbi:hypothetical protein PIB30_020793, partial [Stylosanthes scabra]|nr:hypothetical protein [Stylosanthes scabra]
MSERQHKLLALVVYNDKIKHLLEPDNLPWHCRITFHRLNINHDSRLEGLFKMSDLVYLSLQALCFGEIEDVSSLEEKLGSSLDEVKLKEKDDLFMTKLSLLLKGTVAVPPDKFVVGSDGVKIPHKLIPLSLLLKGTVVAPPGETLQDERINGGAFVVGSDGVQIPHKLIPNAEMCLYGGAQYHRAMAEFRFVVGGIKCPPITREEIVNACGVEDIQDGTNYSRTACVIAVAKAGDTFEPSLHQAVDAFSKGNYARADRLMEQAVQFVFYYIVSGYLKAIVFHFHMPLKL